MRKRWDGEISVQHTRHQNWQLLSHWGARFTTPTWHFFSLGIFDPVIMIQFWLLDNFDRHSEQYSFQSIHFQNTHSRLILQSLPLTTALAEIWSWSLGITDDHRSIRIGCMQTGSLNIDSSFLLLSSFLYFILFVLLICYLFQVWKVPSS